MPKISKTSVKKTATKVKKVKTTIKKALATVKKQVIVEFNESLKDSKKILEKIGEAGFEVRK